MDDSVAVGEARRAQNLLGELNRTLGRQWRLLAHDRVERSPVEVLHRDVVGPAPLSAVVDVDDVRVRERGRTRGLAAEALDELLVLREPLVQQLDGDAPAELGVLCAVDLGHPTGADARDHAVASVDDRPGRDLVPHPPPLSRTSRTALAIGAAMLPPKPFSWCSSVTAIAILGWSTGA